MSTKSSFDREVPLRAGENGEVIGYALTYNNIDYVGDRCMPGCAAEWLAHIRADTVPTAVFYSHEYDDAKQLIGAIPWDGWTDTKYGLQCRMLLDIDSEDNPTARIVFKMVRAGLLTGMSIGWQPEPGGYRKAKDGAMNITALTLNEVSICEIPANDLARVTDTKALTLTERARRLDVANLKMDAELLWIEDRLDRGIKLSESYMQDMERRVRDADDRSVKESIATLDAIERKTSGEYKPPMWSDQSTRCPACGNLIATPVRRPGTLFAASICTSIIPATGEMCGVSIFPEEQVKGRTDLELRHDIRRHADVMLADMQRRVDAEFYVESKAAAAAAGQAGIDLAKRHIRERKLQEIEEFLHPTAVPPARTRKSIREADLAWLEAKVKEYA